MEALFRELLGTLSQAQLAVQDELASLMRQPSRDGDHLSRLATSVSEFSVQADGLLVMMLERSAPVELIDTAETLVDFFHDTVDQLTDRIVASRG